MIVEQPQPVGHECRIRAVSPVNGRAVDEPGRRPDLARPTVQGEQGRKRDAVGAGVAAEHRARHRLTTASKANGAAADGNWQCRGERDEGGVGGDGHTRGQVQSHGLPHGVRHQIAVRAVIRLRQAPRRGIARQNGRLGSAGGPADRPGARDGRPLSQTGSARG
jgi:hypothetical protein